jgi:hypothetical protein
METLGGRGIAPTYSRPRHYMEVSGQRQARPRFTPGERTPGTHCTGGWVGPRAGLDTEDRRRYEQYNVTEDKTQPGLTVPYMYCTLTTECIYTL